MTGRFVVVDDVPTAFADLVTTSFAERVGERFAIAFSGGSTARACYETLARRSEAIDWSAVVAWWGDERCVPLDHADSNHRLVHEALLDHVAPVAGDHPMRCADGAEAYDALVRGAAPLDLVHLGLGPDGHTASLFPGSEALEAPADRFVVMNRDPLGHNVHDRMTFTFAAIAAARRVVVTVAGEDKREALDRVRAGDLGAPAARIVSEDLVWLVDRAAWGPTSGR